MKEKNIWNHAANAGLALGAVSTAYMFITQFIGTSNLPAFVTLTLGVVLWGAKFGGCIYLMMFFMRKVVKDVPNANNSTTFKFGALTALLSALVYAAATFANMAYLSADLMSEQYAMIMDLYKNIMDSNSLNMMDRMMDRMPQISFFSNLIYCSLYGILLSSILSRMIPSKDPFANYKQEEK